MVWWVALAKGAGKAALSSAASNAASSGSGETIGGGKRRKSEKINSPNVNPEDFTSGKDYNHEKNRIQ